MDATILLAVYKKQERCQAFVADAGNPKTMVDMVQTGVRHVVAMGVMQDAYHDWKHILQAEQNWNCWKKHFSDAFNELKEFNAITTESIGYGEYCRKNDYRQCHNGPQQLASTAISKTDAIKNLQQQTNN